MSKIIVTAKEWLNHENKNTRIRNYTLLLLVGALFFGSLSALVIHNVDQVINGAEFVEIELDDETKQDYEDKILDFIQYENTIGLTWSQTKKKKDEIYVYIFDGHVYNIFVFKNDELIKHGTNQQYELIPVKKQ